MELRPCINPITGTDSSTELFDCFWVAKPDGRPLYHVYPHKASKPHNSRKENIERLAAFYADASNTDNEISPFVNGTIADSDVANLAMADRRGNDRQVTIATARGFQIFSRF